jgi:hypothetical protein
MKQNGANFRDQAQIKRLIDAGETPSNISNIINVELNVVEAFAQVHKKSGKKAPKKQPDVMDGAPPV